MRLLIRPRWADWARVGAESQEGAGAGGAGVGSSRGETLGSRAIGAERLPLKDGHQTTTVSHRGQDHHDATSSWLRGC